MNTSDKWLVGIVAGAVLLVCVAVAVTLLRPKPAYRSEATPAGVTHNYLLALKQQQYARAYGYLSPRLPGYPPDARAFADDVDEQSAYTFDFDGVSLETDGARERSDRTIVTVRKTTFSSDGLSGSQQYTSTFDVALRREGTAWKIIHADDYWAGEWEQKPTRR
jgi:hypothetical protein